METIDLKEEISIRLAEQIAFHCGINPMQIHLEDSLLELTKRNPYKIGNLVLELYEQYNLDRNGFDPALSYKMFETVDDLLLHMIEKVNNKK